MRVRVSLHRRDARKILDLTATASSSTATRSEINRPPVCCTERLGKTKVIFFQSALTLIVLKIWGHLISISMMPLAIP